MSTPIPKFRASSLSALADCGAYKSKPFEENENTKAGTARHSALEAALKNSDRTLLEALPEDDRVGVEWAIDQIETTRSSEHPMEFEKSAIATIDGIKVSGRYDCVAGDQGFDLKWRMLADKSNEPQVAFYSLMAMAQNGLTEFTYTLLYGEPKIAKTIKYTKKQAEKIVRAVVKNAVKGEARACSWCGWCSRAATCPALNETAITVAKSYSTELSLYDPKSLSDPKMLARALTMSRAIKAWQNEIESRAKEAALSGVVLDGFKLTEHSLPQKVTDLNRAFNLIAQHTGMSTQKFMACCSLQSGRLIDAVAKATGVSKTAAGVNVRTLLAEVFEAKQKSKCLTKIHSKNG